jgi:DNA repair protein RadC
MTTDTTTPATADALALDATPTPATRTPRRRPAHIGLTVTAELMQVRECTDKPIRDPAACYAELADIGQLAQEAFIILTLTAKNRMITRHLCSLGLLDAAPVHPREVFRPAIQDSAAGLILAHNHPSGDPTPSAEDLRVTRQLIDAGNIIGIRVLDHIIIGRPTDNDPGYLSLRDKGLVTFTP